MTWQTLGRPALTVALLIGIVGLLLPGRSLAQEADQDPASAQALVRQFALVDGRPLDDRLPQPEDRYAVASGCYTIEAPGAGWVTRDGTDVALGDEADAVPLHFQAIRLGEYLLATNEGPSDDVPDAFWDDRGYLGAAPVVPDSVGIPPFDDALVPVLSDEPAPVTNGVAVAPAPSLEIEVRLRAAGSDPDATSDNGQSYLIDLPRIGKTLEVAGGALTLADGDAPATPFVLHHVEDDDPSDDDLNGALCATWPEISTNTSGAPTPPGGGAAGEVEGFFEAHVHGMAFEFLGGKVRCGAPWHKYGVEFALPNCQESGELGNPATEAALFGQDPTSYDPVGWPTFNFWPQYDVLSHEQYYWKWLERAYNAGLRLTTNLLVDNTALCQAFPQKKNSCNEMDGVRLQAKRMFQFQEYIDAQSGGPGEGWYRIVTTPAEARRAINGGRMAVILGIEISVLLDCGEIMGAPQCTTDDIDTRLQEVFDMGVRQMELINKFDNALSGVTGDNGATGAVVNQGNKIVTGHYWDMRTCPESADDGHEHAGQDTILGTQYDKLQPNASDDLGGGQTPEEIDVLAGLLFENFGGATSAAGPVYPAGPHCNSAGLTDLGIYLVEQMIRKGMIVDPDHMSALGQEQLLDHVEDVVIPAEAAEAAAEGRAVILPSLISSHSWGNDVIYQRVHELAGQVAPRTGSADRFVDRWAQNRGWAESLDPDDITFGMGYGADTNGFGGQPGPREDPATPLTYTPEGWTSEIGDVQVFQQVSGTRTFDIAEGVAHYGILADWFRELRIAADEQYPELGGADAIMADMLYGPENYLQMWERAVYGGNPCVTDGAFFQPEDLHALIGANMEGFLEAIGQPADRSDDVYTYCAEGEGGEILPMDVKFDDDGTATGVTPNPGTVTPVNPAPVPTPDAVAAPLPNNPLPTTGGGLTTAALLLMGMTALLARRRHEKP